MFPEVTGWLAEFEKALSASDETSLVALFRPDAHWRDLLAFTWQVKTVSGARKIVDALKLHGASAGAAGFEIDPRRTPPRRVTRAGTKVIEAIFRFETDRVRGKACCASSRKARSTSAGPCSQPSMKSRASRRASEGEDRAANRIPGTSVDRTGST
jgi:ketosteroid isomerase-like protein